MKMHKLLTFAVLATIMLQACTKPDNTTIVTPPAGKLVRLVEGTSMSLQNDTVYDVQYSSSGQVSAVYDSTHFDSLIASYDANGNLVAIKDVTTGPSPTFTYNSGLLTTIDYHLANVHVQYSLAYVGGILSKISYSTDNGSGGALVLQEFYLVTIAGGNIVENRAYSPANALLTDTKYAYGADQNVFQQLSLFNMANRMGANDLFNIFTFFNNNLTVAYVQGSHAVTFPYVFNDYQQPLTVAVNDMVSNNTYTWAFFYE